MNDLEIDYLISNIKCRISDKTTRPIIGLYCSLMLCLICDAGLQLADSSERQRWRWDGPSPGNSAWT